MQTETLQTIKAGQLSGVQIIQVKTPVMTLLP